MCLVFLGPDATSEGKISEMTDPVRAREAWRRTRRAKPINAHFLQDAEICQIFVISRS